MKNLQNDQLCVYMLQQRIKTDQNTFTQNEVHSVIYGDSRRVEILLHQFDICQFRSHGQWSVLL